MNGQPTASLFDDALQQQYAREARLQYGPELVNKSIRRWNGYSARQQAAILGESETIYRELATALAAGIPAQSDAVQAVIGRWHDNLRYFYEPTLEVLQGLGELYASDPAFVAYFQRFHPDLPAYLQESIAHYADALETALLEALLAQDAAQRLSR